MFRVCKVAFIGVLLAIIPVQKTVLWAAEVEASAGGSISSNKAANSNYTGKVVVVDRAAKTVTIEIQKRLYLLKFGPNSKILRNGQKVSIADVITGQEVTVQLVEASAGGVLIATLMIGPAKAETEAAGDPSKRRGPKSFDGDPPGGSPRPVSPYN